MSADYITHFKAAYALTDTGLSSILGVSKPTITLWESGQRGIPETTARLLILFTRYPHLMDEMRLISGTYTTIQLT